MLAYGWGIGTLLSPFVFDAKRGSESCVLPSRTKGEFVALSVVELDVNHILSWFLACDSWTVGWDMVSLMLHSHAMSMVSMVSLMSYPHALQFVWFHIQLYWFHISWYSVGRGIWFVIGFISVGNLWLTWYTIAMVLWLWLLTFQWAQTCLQLVLWHLLYHETMQGYDLNWFYMQSQGHYCYYVSF